MQTHERQRQARFAGAGFTDDSECLSLTQIETDTVNSRPAVNRVPMSYGQVQDSKQRFIHLVSGPELKGSRARVAASPKRMKIKTVTVMATPGGITNQGDCSNIPMDSDNINPQLGFGRCTPRLIKLSPASARMAPPTAMVPYETSGVSE